MLRITVFDVGQASSSLIEFGNKNFGILDFGVSPSSDPNRLVKIIREKLQRNKDSEISFLITTHLDLDHISGLGALLADDYVSSKIRKLYCNHLEYRMLRDLLKDKIKPGSGVTNSKWAMRQLESLKALAKIIRKRSVDDHDFHNELISPLGNHPLTYPISLFVDGVEKSYKINLLSPSQFLRNQALFLLQRKIDKKEDFKDPLASKSREDWNSASAILTIDYAGRRILFSGDATAKTFQEILARGDGTIIQSDVTVAWHHGGRLGSVGKKDYDQLVWGTVLLRRSLHSSPLVLISHGCGNSYGHPHPDTIKEIKAKGGQVLCTELRESAEEALPTDDSFSFEKFGCALTIGGFGNDRFFRHQNRICLGDIIVEIDSEGKIEWSTTQDPNVQHQGTNCCCSEPRATFKT